MVGSRKEAIFSAERDLIRRAGQKRAKAGQQEEDILLHSMNRLGVEADICQKALLSFSCDHDYDRKGVFPWFS